MDDRFFSIGVRGNNGFPLYIRLEEDRWTLAAVCPTPLACEQHAQAFLRESQGIFDEKWIYCDTLINARH